MNIDELKEYREKLGKLTQEEEKQRNLYLKKLANGTLQGPLTGKQSIDKTWLKYYEDYDIKQDIPKMSAYDYMVVNNNSNLDKNALNFYGIKITYEELLKNIDIMFEFKFKYCKYIGGSYEVKKIMCNCNVLCPTYYNRVFKYKYSK